MKSLLARIRPFALVAGFGGALFALGLAMTLDRVFGVEVRLISPHGASTVEVNKALYLPGDPVEEIYGNALSSPVRVIAPDQDRVLRPDEDQTVVLLSVNKQLGENPLQARTVWLFAKLGALGLGLLGVAALAFPRRSLHP
jgi:hypothetical protein